jgi:hypothetical protein
MDYIEGLPLSLDANIIMVLVDPLTKYAHLVPLKHLFTASSVAQAFLDSVVKLHGVPLSIVSDRDKIFISRLWKELFAALGTKLQFTTAYHPQPTDRVNMSIGALRCFCAILCMIRPISGITGYRWLSSGTTHHITRCWAPPHSRHSMAVSPTLAPCL